jgi:hypothetical protein
MRFAIPVLPCEFELPDEWWREAGMVGFDPAGRPAYRSIDSGELVPLREIEPPYRKVTSLQDWYGFSMERMVKILQGIASGAVIDDLVQLTRLTADNAACYRFQVIDGYHRYFASVAAGFGFIPARII